MSFLTWHWLFGLLALWASIALCCLWYIIPETLPPEKCHPIAFKKIIAGYWHILSHQTFMLNSLISGCAFDAMIAWICASSFVVLITFHYTLVQYGFIQGIVFAGFIIGARFVQWGIDRFSLQTILSISISLMLLSSLSMLAVILVYVHTLWVLIIPMMIFALGAGLSFSILNRLAVEASDAPMGLKMAISSSLATLFAVLGSLIASAFVNNLQAFSLCIAVLSGIAFLLYRFFFRLP